MEERKREGEGEGGRAREREMKSEIAVVPGRDCPVFAGFEEVLAFCIRVVGLKFSTWRGFP